MAGTGPGHDESTKVNIIGRWYKLVIREVAASAFRQASLQPNHHAQGT